MEMDIGYIHKIDGRVWVGRSNFVVSLKVQTRNKISSSGNKIWMYECMHFLVRMKMNRKRRFHSTHTGCQYRHRHAAIRTNPKLPRKVDRDIGLQWFLWRVIRTQHTRTSFEACVRAIRNTPRTWSSSVGQERTSWERDNAHRWRPVMHNENYPYFIRCRCAFVFRCMCTGTLLLFQATQDTRHSFIWIAHSVYRAERSCWSVATIVERETIFRVLVALTSETKEMRHLYYFFCFFHVRPFTQTQFWMHVSSISIRCTNTRTISAGFQFSIVLSVWRPKM